VKKKRRTHSAEFKARVALEALKGIKTISQIAQDEGVHPVQVSTCDLVPFNRAIEKVRFWG